MLGVDFDDSHPPAAEQIREPPRPVAPHGIDDHGGLGILNGLEIHQPADLLDIGGGRIEVLNGPAPQALVQRPAGDPVAIVRNGSFDPFEACGIDCAAVVIPHLVPVVGRRVVGGGDIDAPDGAVVDDRVGERRSGRGGLSQKHRDAVSR